MYFPLNTNMFTYFMSKVRAKYLAGLSPSDRSRHKKAILRSREDYKRGKYTDRVVKLPSYKPKRSKHVRDLEKTKVIVTDAQSLYKATGIPPKAQRAILAKGRGAFYSDGSRPGQSAASWAYARLASVALGRGACRVDAHMLPKGVTCAMLAARTKKYARRW